MANSNHFKCGCGGTRFRISFCSKGLEFECIECEAKLYYGPINASDSPEIKPEMEIVEEYYVGDFFPQPHAGDFPSNTTVVNSTDTLNTAVYSYYDEDNINTKDDFGYDFGFFGTNPLDI